MMKKKNRCHAAVFLLGRVLGFFDVSVTPRRRRNEFAWEDGTGAGFG
jgi:hypothetical protein